MGFGRGELSLFAFKHDIIGCLPTVRFSSRNTTFGINILTDRHEQTAYPDQNAPRSQVDMSKDKYG